MKKFITSILLFLFSISFCKGQPIIFPDSNFENKLMQSSLTSSVALDLNFLNIKIDLNNNGVIEHDEAEHVVVLNVSFGSITDLTGIEYFTNLKQLMIQYNSIASMDISALTQLTGLRCDVNNLSSINLNGLNNLEYLQCNTNYITSLDFIGKPNLKSVWCYNNQLTSLDFSNNPLLIHLKCKNNNLTSLNIKNGINQDFLTVGYDDCWKTGNPNLTTVCADASEQVAVQNYLNGCGDVTQVITVVSNCAMGNEEFGINEIKVFPNPTNSTININGNSSIKTIELYDIQGRVLVTKEVNANQTNLDISGYTNGVYFVKITTDNGVKMEKVIKQ
jgi:hypothetical protein